MATRLTYTTGSRSAELDRAFEAALADLRARDAEPLAHLVGGRDVLAGDRFEREDPSRREHVASRSHEGAELVGDAVESARAAQREWRRLPYTERLAILRATESLIQERKLELAAAISMEVGKVRTESIAEVEEAIDLIEDVLPAGRSGGGVRDAPWAAVARRAQRRRPPPLWRLRRHRAVQLPVRARLRDDGGSTRGGQRGDPQAAGGGAALRSVPSRACSPRPACPAGSSRSCTEDRTPARRWWVGESTASRSRARPKSAERSGDGCRRGRFRAPCSRRWAARTRPSSARVPISAGPPRESPRQRSASPDRNAARARAPSSSTRCTTSSSSGWRRSAAAYGVGDPADPEVATGPVVNAQAVERFERSVEATRRDGVVAAGGSLGDPAGWFVEPTVVSGLAPGHPLTRDELFLPFLTVVRVPDFDAGARRGQRGALRPHRRRLLARRRRARPLPRRDRGGVVYVNRRAGATTGAWPGIQSFCGWKSSGSTGKGGLGPWYVQQFAREQSRTIVEP